MVLGIVVEVRFIDLHGVTLAAGLKYTGGTAKLAAVAVCCLAVDTDGELVRKVKI